MQTSWKIGSLFGIPLFLDPLWFIILTFVTLNFGLNYLQWGNVLAGSAGLVMALLLFGSVVLHELLRRLKKNRKHQAKRCRWQSLAPR